jgi:HlyD family secretion protein
MKKRLGIIVSIVVAALAVILWNLYDGRDGADGQIHLSGNMDVTQVDLAFKIAGRLQQRLVDEGHPVTRGQCIAILDDTDQKFQQEKAAADLAYALSVLSELQAGSRPEEIDRAAARVRQARFALDERIAGSRNQEIAEAQADLKRAMADEQTAGSELALARSDFNRYAAVFEEGGISRQTFEVYRTRLETAKSARKAAASRRQASGQRLSLRQAGSRSEQIDQARWILAQAEADYALVAAGPRKETIDQAKARVAAATAGLNIARQQVAETELFAPFDGVVLSTSAEPGAYLNPGATVLTVGDTEHIWLRAFVTETDLGRIRLGQSAEVAIDAYPDRRWTGTISFISSEAEFTPKSVQTSKERVNLVYRIKIQLTNPDGVLKPGMPADAVIEVKS